MGAFQEWCEWWSCSCKCFENRFWYFLKSCFGTAHGWANWFVSVFTDFLLFFVVSFVVQAILPEGV